MYNIILIDNQSGKLMIFQNVNLIPDGYNDEISVDNWLTFYAGVDVLEDCSYTKVLASEFNSCIFNMEGK